MEESKWLIPVCYVPVAVGDPRNCADSWDPSLMFDTSFAENQPCMTQSAAIRSQLPSQDPTR
jgi:hypothetical protein